jgi:glyoxylase-like metal-dependent hydrolase (beta-lactamase superfamily II)
MRPVSAQQFRSATSGMIPAPERIANDLWSLPIPMPGGSLRYSLSVIHRAPNGALTVIDPGTNSAAALHTLERFLATINRSVADVSLIVVTHAHPDHIGLAGPLRRETGAPVLMHEREQQEVDARRQRPGTDHAEALAGWGVPEEIAADLQAAVADAEHEAGVPESADILLTDGQILPIHGTDWHVRLTPGHTPGHLSIIDRDRELLIAGDHVLPTLFPGIGLGYQAGAGGLNPLSEYLDSLERLADLDHFHVIPGHGYQFLGLRARRDEIITHSLRRAQEVGDVLHDDPAASAWSIASRITWRSGWDRLARSAFAVSALSQIDMYKDFATCNGLKIWEERMNEVLSPAD